MHKAVEFGEQIPTGVIWKNPERTPFESKYEDIFSAGPLCGREPDLDALEKVMEEYAVG
jgi:hypothetical protein